MSFLSDDAYVVVHMSNSGGKYSLEVSVIPEGAETLFFGTKGDLPILFRQLRDQYFLDIETLYTKLSSLARRGVKESYEANFGKYTKSISFTYSGVLDKEEVSITLDIEQEGLKTLCFYKSGHKLFSIAYSGMNAGDDSSDSLNRGYMLAFGTIPSGFLNSIDKIKQTNLARAMVNAVFSGPNHKDIIRTHI